MTFLLTILEPFFIYLILDAYLTCLILYSGFFILSSIFFSVSKFTLIHLTIDLKNEGTRSQAWRSWTLRRMISKTSVKDANILKRWPMLRRIPYSLNNNISFVFVFVWLTLVECAVMLVGVFDLIPCFDRWWCLAGLVPAVTSFILSLSRQCHLPIPKENKLWRSNAKSLFIATHLVSLLSESLCQIRSSYPSPCESRDKIMFKG
jgi:hypothetical protein